MRADKDINYDVISLDLSKAFDRILHQKLLIKIKAHGIDGKVYNWIKTWFNGREHRVEIDGRQSNWSEVISRVPQRSVLNPLLLII